MDVVSYGGQCAETGRLPGNGGEGRGRQDKGNAARPCLTYCLHVVFLGDSEKARERVPLPRFWLSPPAEKGGSLLWREGGDAR